MTEVYSVVELFNELKEAIGDREVELHLDLNSDERFGSNCVMQQAIGYVKGTTGIMPKIKPEAPAASFCADRMQLLLDEQKAA
jgi:predicted RNase H-related nuclease YkuK (DUF458 family)